MTKLIFAATSCEPPRASDIWLTTLDLMVPAMREQPDAVTIVEFDTQYIALAWITARRAAGVNNPVMILLDLDRLPIKERIGALHHLLMAGADDVQSTKIDPRELNARMHALDRRGTYVDGTGIVLAGGVYSFNKSCFTIGGHRVMFTPAENAILWELVRYAGFTRERERLLDIMPDRWSGDGPQIKIVDVYICKLRKKFMDATGGIDVIETVWGHGFRLVPEGYVPVKNTRTSHRLTGTS